MEPSSAVGEPAAPQPVSSVTSNGQLPGLDTSGWDGNGTEGASGWDGNGTVGADVESGLVNFDQSLDLPQVSLFFSLFLC